MSRKCPPRIPAGSEVDQQLPINCRAIAPIAEILAEAGRMLAEFGHKWSMLDRLRPELAGSGKLLAQVRRKLAELALEPAKFAEIWLNSR